MNTGIYIGVEKQAVEALGKIVLAILASEQDQATMQVALQTLLSTLSVHNVSLTGCTITMSQGEEKEAGLEESSK